ncbi:glycerophosphodiester phosphodiesterase [Pseudonocardiaceae bacterium YIM PH 21723]|nr:glycerophosphodiester phosphodiesterase [Pseudonocardiaceae bacterium YIM PH 21723]
MTRDAIRPCGGHRFATPVLHTVCVLATHPYLSGSHPRAFAHRGWHIDDLEGMENSMAAFRRAIDEGFRYLEIDVHATSDGVVVVHHDEELDRTTDGHGPIASLPWSQVGAAKIGGREGVPALEAVLEELPSALLNIDVKAEQAVEPVLELIRRTDAWDRVCLASFSDERLARLRRAGGERLITSMGPKNGLVLWVSGKLGLQVGRVNGAMAQVPRKQGPLTVVDRRFLRGAHRRGIEVHVWTIDERAEMIELLDLGVDGLVTDRPDVLRAVLRERGQWPE